MGSVVEIVRVRLRLRLQLRLRLCVMVGLGRTVLVVLRGTGEYVLDEAAG